MASALHQKIQPRHDGIAGEATARKREISGNRAVTRTESPNTVGTEPAGPTAGFTHEVLELEPRGRSLRNELV